MRHSSGLKKKILAGWCWCMLLVPESVSRGRGSLSSRPVWPMMWVPGQPRLHSKTLSQKKIQNHFSSKYFFFYLGHIWRSVFIFKGDVTHKCYQLTDLASQLDRTLGKDRTDDWWIHCIPSLSLSHKETLGGRAATSRGLAELSQAHLQEHTVRETKEWKISFKAKSRLLHTWHVSKIKIIM